MSNVLASRIGPKPPNLRDSQRMASLSENVRSDLAAIAQPVIDCLNVPEGSDPSISEFRTHAPNVQRYSFNRFVL